MEGGCVVGHTIPDGSKVGDIGLLGDIGKRIFSLSISGIRKVRQPSNGIPELTVFPPELRWRSRCSE